MAKRKASRNPRSQRPSASNPPPPRAERELVVVMEPVVGLRARTSGLTAASAESVQDINSVLSRYGATIQPLFGSSESRLARDVTSASGTSAHDSEIAQYYRVDAAQDQLDELANALRGQPTVKAAYVKPPAEPPYRLNDMQPESPDAPAVTPDFTSRQGYLLAAPGGVDANFAWTVSGGRGDGVRVIDIEGAWLFSHEDLLGNQGGVVGGTPSSDIGWRNHGTAVVGEIGGDSNPFGITGIAPNAHQRAISIFGGMGSAQAIKTAADMLGPGDVILIELHRAGPRFNFQPRQDQRGYIAIEWWPDDFEAIRYAVVRGIVVVEAAGNGAENLDDAIYQTPDTGFPTGWTNPFRRTNRDSGAVVVGAGAPPPGTHGRDHGPDRSRLDFSNYGELIDAQGWGREVTTTGYGDLQGGSEANWYTDQFSGTSSASPIVVGAISCLQGALRAQGRPAFAPVAVRDLLRTTGSPQQDAPGRPVSQRIGNRPNLRQMIQRALPPTTRPRLRLVGLLCERTEDWLGPDEAYVKVNDRRVWGPVNLNNGQFVSLRSVSAIAFRERAKVDLYDQDAGWLDRDDHLGATYARATEQGRGEREHQFTANGARYTLTYEVV